MFEIKPDLRKHCVQHDPAAPMLADSSRLSLCKMELYVSGVGVVGERDTNNTVHTLSPDIYHLAAEHYKCHYTLCVCALQVKDCHPMLYGQLTQKGLLFG